MKRWIGVLFALLALGGAGWFGLTRWKASPAAAIQYKTAPLERGDLRASVTATGTLSAVVTVQVGSQVSGRLSEVLVDFGSPVKKGQILARIDPELLRAAASRDRASLSVAQGSLARARANLAGAELRRDRAKNLVEQGVGNRSDLEDAKVSLDAARADVQVARGQVEQANAALKQSEINLNNAVISSPVDGVVISRTVDVGQTVAASLQAPTLFTIAGDLRKMQVDTSVAEADVGKIKAGMAALFTVDAFPGETFKGSVRQIRDAAQTVQNVVTYNAVIDVDNPELHLKPGMTANVRFVYAEREGVLRVANAALRFRPPAEALPSGSAPGRQRPPGEPRGEGRGEKGRGERPRVVWVLRDGKPQRVRVKLGVSDGSFTEIVEGELNEGDAIITDADAPAERPAPALPGAAPGGAQNRGMRRVL
ncbi:MAG: efflux RND transporter periplasmic adaptor subunit [Polyangiaceae bacterium]|jgi:HlyD family secretion protein|nr:efflux RND transporter periplasmic adaptor subunit [Polyangiaceae bacterium]